MIFEYNGEIKIEEGLELLSPKMKLKKVFYDLETNEFQLEVYFWENKFPHSRLFYAVNNQPGSLNMNAIMDFVSNHPILSQFNLKSD